MLSWPTERRTVSEDNFEGYAVYFSILDGENVVGVGTFG